MKHRMIYKAFAMAVVLLLSACSLAEEGRETGDTAAISQEIRTTIRTIVTAFNNHDADMVTSFDAPDILMMFHGQPNIHGAEASRANVRNQLSDPAVKLTIGEKMIEVSRSGDFAFFTTSYAYDYTDPVSRQIMTETGNWVIIFKRQPDGSMRIYREIVSDTPSE